MFAKVHIDYSKCVTPFDCKRCLEVCPQAAFMVRPVKVERGKETDKKQPGTYKLGVYYADKCTACNDCVNVCPVDALRITLQGATRA